METRALIEGTCPECRGPLSELRDGDIIEFTCLVGHRYSPSGLLQAHYETQERALWAAVVSLEESPKLVHAIASHLGAEAARILEQIAADKMEQAQQVRKVIESLKPYLPPE